MKKTFLFVIFFLTLLTSNSFAEFKFVQTKDVSTDKNNKSDLKPVIQMIKNIIKISTNRHSKIILLSLNTPYKKRGLE